MKSKQQKLVEKLKKNFIPQEEVIENTEKNMREAEISMEFANPDEYENLQEKNERRKHAIQRMKNEPLS